MPKMGKAHFVVIFQILQGTEEWHGKTCHSQMAAFSYFSQLTERFNTFRCSLKTLPSFGVFCLWIIFSCWSTTDLDFFLLLLNEKKIIKFLTVYFVSQISYSFYFTIYFSFVQILFKIYQPIQVVCLDQEVLGLIDVNCCML